MCAAVCFFMHGTIPRSKAVAAPLAVLAAEIKRAHGEVESAARRSLEAGIIAGEKLIEAKHHPQMKHGGWLPWLKKLGIPRRTASHYMELAKKKTVIEMGNVAHLTVRAALESIRKPHFEYYTPKKYIEAARRVLGNIDLDPASCPEANKVVRAGKFFTAKDDGLTRPWRGRVFLNPPYCGLAGRFVDKLAAELQAGNIKAAIVLVNGYHTDMPWFRPLLGRSALLHRS
jgi:DNA N-6-adenine-methyltransferase Dam